MNERNELEYENEHVHRVYDKIATHFSDTRYKPWPVVEHFLNSLPVGAIGLDIGCGNGKYQKVNPNIYLIGSDRCEKLVRIASQLGPMIVADGLHVPHPSNRTDFALSIAVIHHFSNEDRRLQAVQEVLRVLRKGGRALFFVWALEQNNSRRGFSENGPQDVHVPWVLKRQYEHPNAKPEDLKGHHPSENVAYQRYYHLFRKGELSELVQKAGGKLIEDGYDRDNWWAIVEKL
ncbi:tRNA methyltransferase Trm9 [Schizosaccharomyces cryophilus OY26]|uniref:tRNA methyltransferase Trm9 n=1 Tax=Schizosaccharomyces cryophilus (strain OY26 / ATCC MYA-4695 / CBS 11777 / NBRC 106824 / NRRL Y48691) TaxID=653667 RepID=S9X3W1_SCHCR|nr:tRNA methyltransferase Trm9 [Schizosaccharomyces cryophilus OY26]EPY51797.1 tRNA methyltransferase Trm9 [Schizosaccharomyces cryophilus OY26]